MLDQRVLNAVRKMNRLDQEYRRVDDHCVIRRITFDEATRKRLAESYQRVLNWGPPQTYGVTVIQGKTLPGRNDFPEVYYLVVTLDGFSPESVTEFDRVFFDGKEPQPRS